MNATVTTVVTQMMPAALMLGATLLGRPAIAAQAVNCGGVAMMGGAQLVCSHTSPKLPTQFCTFSWALLTLANAPTVVQGSFLVPPGASNTSVYQGSGFNAALSNPIILCQGRRSH